MQGLPNKTASTFHEQPVGDELLLYNETTHEAFCLNPTAAQVWKSCDGVRDVHALTAALAQVHGDEATTELVELTLDELQRDGLIAPLAVRSEMTRRAMMGTLGVRAAMLLPVVAMVMAPTAAQAYTGCFNCGTTAQHTVDSSLAVPSTDVAPVPKTSAGTFQSIKQPAAVPGDMPRMDGTQP